MPSTDEDYTDDDDTNAPEKSGVTSEGSEVPDAADEDSPACKDTWSVSRDLLIRFHVTSFFFSIPGDDFPLPLKFIYVQRKTECDLDSKAETKTEFELSRPVPLKGYKCAVG